MTILIWRFTYYFFTYSVARYEMLLVIQSGLVCCYSQLRQCRNCLLKYAQEEYKYLQNNEIIYIYIAQ